MIVHSDLETYIYKTAVKAGVLNGGLCRNYFDLCLQKLFYEEDANLDNSVSLHSAVTAHSASGRRASLNVNLVDPPKKKKKRFNAL